MTTVVLGNRHAIHTRDNSETWEPLEGKLATRVELPDDMKLGEAFQAITHEGGVWTAHSARQNGAWTTTEDGKDTFLPDGESEESSDAYAPAWVASDNKVLASFLGEHYRCEVRDLEEAAQ